MSNAFGFTERTYSLKCSTLGLGWAWTEDQTGDLISPRFPTQQQAEDWQYKRAGASQGHHVEFIPISRVSA